SQWAVTASYEPKIDFEKNSAWTHSAKLQLAKRLEELPVGFFLSIKKPFNGDKQFQVNFVSTYYFSGRARGQWRHESVHSNCMGSGIAPRKIDIAGAESFHSLEGNMCGTVRQGMRGAVALPGSKATSRAKGSYRNLGDLVSGRQALRERDGPHREGEEPKPMMHGREKSDPAIVCAGQCSDQEG
ncbi:MAG TPA: hypothetical protein VGD41_09205, partial [Pyrinomonadaceae bacterium]